MLPNIVQAMSVVLFTPSPNNFSQVLVTLLCYPYPRFKLQELANLRYSLLSNIHNVGIYIGKVAPGQALATHVWCLHCT